MKKIQILPLLLCYAVFLLALVAALQPSIVGIQYALLATLWVVIAGGAIGCAIIGATLLAVNQRKFSDKALRDLHQSLGCRSRFLRWNRFLTDLLTVVATACAGLIVTAAVYYAVCLAVWSVSILLRAKVSEQLGKIAEPGPVAHQHPF